MPPSRATLGDTLQLFSFAFCAYRSFAIRRGERLDPGLMCCDEHVCQNCDSSLKLFKLYFHLPSVDHDTSELVAFCINYMAYFSKIKRRKTSIRSVLLLLVI